MQEMIGQLTMRNAEKLALGLLALVAVATVFGRIEQRSGRLHYEREVCEASGGVFFSTRESFLCLAKSAVIRVPETLIKKH